MRTETQQTYIQNGLTSHPSPSFYESTRSEKERDFFKVTQQGNQDTVIRRPPAPGGGLAGGLDFKEELVQGDQNEPKETRRAVVF